jgi:spermidine synthase
MQPSANHSISTASAAPSGLAPKRRILRLLMVLFVGSGCAALIYEIVWFQLLSLIIGSAAVSLAVLLGTFMGGMCLGSLFLARFVPPGRHPLRVYAALEAGIGVFGLLVLWGLPYAGGLYFAIALHGTADLFLRGMFCAICLLPPTLLMGATLPAISRWVETTPEGVSWLGFFYGGNIGGAVFGCLLAGFYLLRVYDMAVATYAAVAINALVACAGCLLSRHAAYEPAGEGREGDSAAETRGATPAGAWPVYVTIGLSGMTALAAEAVWTRILSLLFGATTYTFSLILAAFLVGLGLGGSAGAAISRSARRPRTALGLCQLLLTLAIAWAAYSMARLLPYWPVQPDLSTKLEYTFQMDLARCLFVVLPAAILWGASFPLALAAMGRGERDPGRMVGRVYAANTVGGIAGALAGSLVIISWFGSQWAQRILILIAAVSALFALLPAIGSRASKVPANSRRFALGLLTLSFAALVVRTVPPVPPLLVGYGRWFASRLDNANDFLYVGEGMTASIAVSQMEDGVLCYHNAGKVQASSEPQDMRIERMMGHLATLLPPDPKSVLVIGCGAGITAGAASIEPALERETIAEIEPLVPKAASRYFGAFNYNVVTNPKVHVEIDDARHFILTTKEKFDAVTSDPLDTWVKGAATLYTQEFFEVVKKHLNPGGIMTLFVQLYESNTEGVKSEIATFFKAFPNGVVFANTVDGAGYDLVLVGQEGGAPMKIDIDAIQERLESPRYAEVAKSLREVGFENATQLFSTFAGNEPMLRPWIADAQINHDRNLRLQFIAGLGLNLYDEAGIYSEMEKYRAFPDGLFTGKPGRLAQIRNALAP